MTYCCMDEWTGELLYIRLSGMSTVQSEVNLTDNTDQHSAYFLFRINITSYSISITKTK